MKATQYRVVRKVHEISEEALDVLQETINCMIKDGWQPIGGLAIDKTKLPEVEYAQAMIKVEDK